MTEQRKLAAVMFTDIVGYTALMSKDEKKALALLQKNRELQKSLAEEHNGEFLKEMGDGTLLCFQSALESVRCAMEIQNAVKDEPGLYLRIGIHLGDIVFKEGDIFGDGVNVASRIEKLAESGCICISEEVYRSIRNQPEIGAVLLEEKRLKNVDHPIKIYALESKGKKISTSGDTVSKERQSKEKSIIVLPFENMSPDPQQEYFSDGLTEEIITDLSHIHDLLVISRSSAMTFKGAKKKIRDIADEVNVQYVLEGSVRKAGNNLRITAQLIDSKNDAHLWAEKYSGTLDDIFRIQEEVSQSIVAALKMKLSPEEKTRIAFNPLTDIFAYECFLKARHELWKWTGDGLDNALDYLQKGLEATGENPVLLAGLGYVYYQYINTGIKTDELTLKKAEEYTKRALKMDPESPNGHIVQALLEGWRGKPRVAIDHYKSALAVEPNNFDALVWYPCFCSFLGVIDPVMPYVERLQRVDPLHPMTYFTFGLVHVMDGKFETARDSMELVHKNYPKDHLTRWLYAQTLHYCGYHEKGYSVAERLIKETPNDLLAKVGFAAALGLRNRTDEGITLLQDENIEPWGKADMGASFWLAEAYSVLHKVDKALSWLENAIVRGFMNYPFLERYNPLLEPIRDDERFTRLISKVKNEWENIDV